MVNRFTTSTKDRNGGGNELALCKLSEAPLRICELFFKNLIGGESRRALVWALCIGLFTWGSSMWATFWQIYNITSSMSKFETELTKVSTKLNMVLKGKKISIGNDDYDTSMILPPIANADNTRVVCLYGTNKSF